MPKKVSIRKLTIDDSEKIVLWRNKERVRNNLLTTSLITIEQQKQYFDTFVSTGLIHQFVVQYNGNDCGTTFLKNIDLENKTAEIGIFIGEDSAIGKGVAKEAIVQTLLYGFNELFLRYIFLFVLADNVVALKLYKKVGFKEQNYIFVKRDSLNIKAYKMILDNVSFQNAVNWK